MIVILLMMMLMDEIIIASYSISLYLNKQDHNTNGNNGSQCMCL
jgi:hypothetical protein